MSNTNDQLSRRDQLLIESYREQTAAWKHEGDLLYRFTSVILPLSIAALGVPYLQKGVPDLLATVGGLTLMAFWAITCQIMHIKSNIRFTIINEIERCWKVPAHEEFKKRRDYTYGEKERYYFKSHFLRCCMFWIYLAIVGVLTLYRWTGPHCFQEILITESADSLIIIVLIILVFCLVEQARRKAKKKICVKNKDETAAFKNEN